MSAWSTYNRYLCRPLWTVVEISELTSIPNDADWSQMAMQAMRSNRETATDAAAPEVVDLTNRAFRIRPELAGLTAQARVLNAQAEAARGNIRPQVGIGGGFIFLGTRIWPPRAWAC